MKASFGWMLCVAATAVACDRTDPLLTPMAEPPALAKPASRPVPVGEVVAVAPQPALPTPAPAVPTPTPVVPTPTPTPPSPEPTPVQPQMIVPTLPAPAEGEIQARHILIMHVDSRGRPPNVVRSKADAKLLADQLLARIRSGESFEGLAKEFSDDSNRDAGGMLGNFRKGVMVPEFENAAFALNPGETSGVVETVFGYHLIRRTL